MVNLLIERGASVNVTDASGERVLALDEAISHDQINIVKLLVKHGVRVNAIKPGAWSPLCMACNSGLEAIATMLVDSGADLDHASVGSMKPLTAVIDRTAVIDSGFTKLAVKFINKGADITYIDHIKEGAVTPLELACRKNNRSIVNALIENNVDVNAINKSNYNRTPLHVANMPPIIASLIKAGAKINAKDIDGEAPLHEKVTMGCFSAIEALLTNDVDINIKDKNDHTPLFRAIISNEINSSDSREKIIDLLIKKGAKVELNDAEQEMLLNGSVPDYSVTIKLLKNGLKPSEKFNALLDKTINKWSWHLKGETSIRSKQDYEGRLDSLKEIKELYEKNLKTAVQKNNGEKDEIK